MILSEDPEAAPYGEPHVPCVHVKAECFFDRADGGTTVHGEIEPLIWSVLRLNNVEVDHALRNDSTWTWKEKEVSARVWVRHRHMNISSIMTSRLNYQMCLSLPLV